MLQILFVVFFLFALLSINEKRIIVQHELLSFLVICYILSFIRWDTGTDWDSYVSIFNYSKDINNNFTNVEKGFFLLNHIAYIITKSYTFLLFVEATIIFVSIYSILKRQPFPLISFFLLYCSTFGNIMFVRQSISVAIILYSYTYILQKKKGRFYTCILLASCFHTTSLIAIPFYHLFYCQLKWKYYLMIIITAIITGYFFSNVILQILSGGNTYLASKIETYLRLKEYGQDDFIVITPQRAIFNHLLKRILIALLIFLFCRNEIRSDQILNGYLRIYLYSTLIYVFVTPLSLNFSRICTGIEIVDILLYPYILTKIRISSNLKIILTLIILLGYSKFQSNISRFPEIFNNYTTIFQ